MNIEISKWELDGLETAFNSWCELSEIETTDPRFTSIMSDHLHNELEAANCFIRKAKEQFDKYPEKEQVVMENRDVLFQSLPKSIQERYYHEPIVHICVRQYLYKFCTKEEMFEKMSELLAQQNKLLFDQLVEMHQMSPRMIITDLKM